MSYHYEIIEKPHEFKDQIIKLWEENMPETPPGRYEWLTAGNPAGETTWILALDQQTNTLVGFITILPKQFIWKGKTLLFGIMGDFVVDKRCRGFGPGLKLPRYVLNKAVELGFNLVYTIPYYGSLKHAERAGFKNKLGLRWLVKPLVFDHHLRNTILTKSLNIAALLFDMTYRFFFLNPAVLSGKYFVDNDIFSDAFDDFWIKLSKKNQSLTSSRDSNYLIWRYLKNPLTKFQILTLKEQVSDDLLGYVIYAINGGHLNIYDFQYLNKKTKYILIQKLIQIARKEKCNTIYLLTSLGESAPLRLKKFGFIAREEKHTLCYAAIDPDLTLDTFQFFQGDRNV